MFGDFPVSKDIVDEFYRRAVTCQVESRGAYEAWTHAAGRLLRQNFDKKFGNVPKKSSPVDVIIFFDSGPEECRVIDLGVSWTDELTVTYLKRLKSGKWSRVECCVDTDYNLTHIRKKKE